MNNKFFLVMLPVKMEKSNFRCVKISLTEISKYICFTSLANIITFNLFPY